MSKNYTHLSLEQRYQIEALFTAGISQKQIALQLGVHPATICRELKRNTAKRGLTSGEYQARIADRRAHIRHQKKPKHIVFDHRMKELICHYLTVERWSPELISKTVESVTISHEWIYRWIWNCKHLHTAESRKYKELYKYLRHGRRKRKRGNIKDSRGLLLNRTPIDQRPKIVAKRERLGDIEVDLMMGKNHKGAVLVMTDRATLQTRLRKLPSKESSEVLQGIIDALNTNPYKALTLTFDNDKAFSCHTEIALKMNLKTYFTRPYTSQDKGTVENRIGVLRRFLPKKTNLNFVTVKMIEEIEAKLNNRPVRKFKYQTPQQVLLKKIALMT